MPLLKCEYCHKFSQSFLAIKDSDNEECQIVYKIYYYVYVRVSSMYILFFEEALPFYNSIYMVIEH